MKDFRLSTTFQSASFVTAAALTTSPSLHHLRSPPSPVPTNQGSYQVIIPEGERLGWPVGAPAIVSRWACCAFHHYTALQPPANMDRPHSLWRAMSMSASLGTVTLQHPYAVFLSIQPTAFHG